MQRVLEALSEARAAAQAALGARARPHRSKLCAWLGTLALTLPVRLPRCRERLRCLSLRRGPAKRFVSCVRRWRGKPARSHEEVRQQSCSLHVSLCRLLKPALTRVPRIAAAANRLYMSRCVLGRLIRARKPACGHLPPRALTARRPCCRPACAECKQIIYASRTHSQARIYMHAWSRG